MLSTADAPPPLAPTPALRPPRHRVSPRAIRYWTARAGAGWALVVIAQVVWLVVVAGGGEGPVLAPAGAGGVPAAAPPGVPRLRPPPAPRGAAPPPGHPPA